MSQNVTISHLSTKKVKSGNIEYNYRNLDSIRCFVNGISASYLGYKPIYSKQYGVYDDSPGTFLDSIEYFADLYSKNNGILLRGVFVEVPKIDIGDSDENIIRLANEYAKYYIYQGYVLRLIIYDHMDRYVIIYLINPINFCNGYKLRTNNTDILDDEYDCINHCFNKIFCNNPGYDYTSFEAYPLPF